MFDGDEFTTMRQALSLREDQVPMPSALFIIFSLVTTQARLYTCAVQDQSFRDQLSDLRELRFLEAQNLMTQAWDSVMASVKKKNQAKNE